MQRSVGLSRASPDLSMVTILTRPPAQRNAKPISVSAASIPPHAQKFLPATLVKKIVILLHVQGALPLWLDGHGGENHNGMVAIPAVGRQGGRPK